jgi:phage tail protein X
MAKYVTKMFDVLDLICYDYYGDHDRRIVEHVLDVNPGLAKNPIILPLGLEIELPARPVPRNRTDFRQIVLFK